MSESAFPDRLCQALRSGNVPLGRDSQDGLFAEQTLQAFGEDFLLTASIDAAQAAQRLPNVFRLKSGVAIQSGQIHGDHPNDPGYKGPGVDGQARLADLAAV